MQAEFNKKLGTVTALSGVGAALTGLKMRAAEFPLHLLNEYCAPLSRDATEIFVCFPDDLISSLLNTYCGVLKSTCGDPREFTCNGAALVAASVSTGTALTWVGLAVGVAGVTYLAVTSYNAANTDEASTDVESGDKRGEILAVQPGLFDMDQDGNFLLVDGLEKESELDKKKQD